MRKWEQKLLLTARLEATKEEEKLRIKKVNHTIQIHSIIITCHIIVAGIRCRTR